MFKKFPHPITYKFSTILLVRAEGLSAHQRRGWKQSSPETSAKASNYRLLFVFPSASPRLLSYLAYKFRCVLSSFCACVYFRRSRDGRNESKARPFWSEFLWSKSESGNLILSVHFAKEILGSFLLCVDQKFEPKYICYIFGIASLLFTDFRGTDVRKFYDIYSNRDVEYFVLFELSKLYWKKINQIQIIFIYWW